MGTPGRTKKNKTLQAIQKKKTRHNQKVSGKKTHLKEQRRQKVNVRKKKGVQKRNFGHSRLIPVRPADAQKGDDTTPSSRKKKYKNSTGQCGTAAKEKGKKGKKVKYTTGTRGKKKTVIRHKEVPKGKPMLRNEKKESVKKGKTFTQQTNNSTPVKTKTHEQI